MLIESVKHLVVESAINVEQGMSLLVANTDIVKLMAHGVQEFCPNVSVSGYLGLCIDKCSFFYLMVIDS